MINNEPESALAASPGDWWDIIDSLRAEQRSTAFRLINYFLLEKFPDSAGLGDSCAFMTYSTLHKFGAIAFGEERAATSWFESILALAGAP